ncbi:MAG: hypothetical protein K6E85_11485 [Lachnospiraceae bacterium]|nr:hypothetical protein [Lachnospiraceae bacterium]
MLEILKSIWQVIVGMAIATKPFWWSDFWWMNGIKIAAVVICAALDISSKGERKLIKFGLAIYGVLSVLSLFIT